MHYTVRFTRIYGSFFYRAKKTELAEVIKRDSSGKKTDSNLSIEKPRPGLPQTPKRGFSKRGI